MTEGEELFCRYAYHPNQLGYCGPSQWDGLDVRSYAQGFAGAWAYQQVIADMMGLDPLDAEVVTTYWTGTQAGDKLGRTEFWERLLTIIGPQASSYWAHLHDPALPQEATPSHAFHVLGIYPWTRLLEAGPEAIEVLNNCLLRPAQIRGNTAYTRALRYRGGQLHWEDSAEELAGAGVGGVGGVGAAGGAGGVGGVGAGGVGGGGVGAGGVGGVGAGGVGGGGAGSSQPRDLDQNHSSPRASTGEDLSRGILHWGQVANMCSEADAKDLWRRLEEQVILTNRRLSS